MTVQCCVCKKVKVEEEWTQNGTEAATQVSHTYFPVCYSEARVQLRGESAFIKADPVCQTVT